MSLGGDWQSLIDSERVCINYSTLARSVNLSLCRSLSARAIFIFRQKGSTLQPQALERFLRERGTLLNGTWFIVGSDQQALADLVAEIARPSKCAEWGMRPGMARWENLKRAARERERVDRTAEEKGGDSDG